MRGWGVGGMGASTGEAVMVGNLAGESSSGIDKSS